MFSWYEEQLNYARRHLNELIFSDFGELSAVQIQRNNMCLTPITTDDG